MKISIIIPAYNAGRTINRCLTSVVNQTYRNIEVIVINDGSKDNTRSVSNKIALKDKRILIFDQINSGVYHSRKSGLTHSTGESILFIDADDYLEKNAIELLVKKMNETNVDMVIGNHFHHENGLKKKVANKIPSAQTKHTILSYLLLGTLKGYIWGRLIKRNLLKGIYHSKGYALTDDVLTNFQIVCNNNIQLAIVELPIHNYVIHGSNITLSHKATYVDSRYDHLEIVEQMIEETGLKDQLKNELCAYKCRAWIDYCRMGGYLARDKAFFNTFYDAHYPFAKKYIRFYQRIEMLSYKRNYTLGKFSTKSMKWIQNKLWN